MRLWRELHGGQLRHCSFARTLWIRSLGGTILLCAAVFFRNEISLRRSHLGGPDTSLAVFLFLHGLWLWGLLENGVPILSRRQFMVTVSIEVLVQADVFLWSFMFSFRRLSQAWPHHIYSLPNF